MYLSLRLLISFESKLVVKDRGMIIMKRINRQVRLELSACLFFVSLSNLLYGFWKIMAKTAATNIAAMNGAKIWYVRIEIPARAPKNTYVFRFLSFMVLMKLFFIIVA